MTEAGRAENERSGNPGGEPSDAAPDPKPGAVLDLETGLSSADHFDLRLWLRMLACTYWIEGEIKSRLKARFGVTLTQFNLLAQLDRARGGIRMRDLSRRTMVTSSNITAVTDQLVAAGLLVRDVDPSDRRAFVIRMTPAGEASFREMARVHEGWVVEMLSKIDPAEKDALYQSLTKLKAALGATLRNSL
ncbi:MAG TPA: MarR family transcriptional regulator [Microvirga sp.]|nr:MarR family transcriptional regulator [Microvirga sp.]